MTPGPALDRHLAFERHADRGERRLFTDLSTAI
jgi:hypothetical protein